MCVVVEVCTCFLLTPTSAAGIFRLNLLLLLLSAIESRPKITSDNILALKFEFGARSTKFIVIECIRRGAGWRAKRLAVEFKNSKKECQRNQNNSGVLNHRSIAHFMVYLYAIVRVLRA
jgi:hypothetical protein